jgi:phosphoketolase
MSIAVEDAVTEHAHILEEQDLRRIDAYWRAANYLSVGQNLSFGQSSAASAAAT